MLAAQIPAARVASAPAGEAERSELRSAGIVMAGSAMGLFPVGRWVLVGVSAAAAGFLVYL